MNITPWAVLFIGLAQIGQGHTQGTMSGMANSMRSSPLMAPAGQGQGPHDIGKGPATEDQIQSGSGQKRPDSMLGANPGNSSGTADDGGAGFSSDGGGTEKARKPVDENSGNTAPMLC
jgi:hypothetical protein